MINFITALVVILCVFICWTYGFFMYLKYTQRLLWDTLYAQLKQKFVLLSDLVFTVREINLEETDIYKNLTDGLGAFISSKTPAETSAAYAKAQTALARLDGSLKKYPSVLNGADYIKIKGEMLKIDEKIGFSSKFYDEGAIKFNAYIRKMPFAAVAAIFNIKKRSGFNAGIN